MKQLNLGCGRFKKEGFINVDICPESGPDVVHDLNVFPYPFEDDTFDVIEADHVLEHLQSPFEVMKELYRILKPSGTLIIRVPHFSRGFMHPDHKRGFNITFPLYFRPDYVGFTGVEFSLMKMRLRWLGQPYLAKTLVSPLVFYPAFISGKIIDFWANLSPLLCSRLWCFWVGGFEEIEFYFKPVKNVS